MRRLLPLLLVLLCCSPLWAVETSWVHPTIPDCQDAGGAHLNYTASTNTFSCGSSGSGAGGGDITAVGSCATGACFTSGSPSGSLVLNNATSGTITLQATTGALGTRTQSFPAKDGDVAISTGTLTSGNCAKFDASGRIVDNGSACNAASGLADPGANGVVVRTSSGVTTARTLTGTTAQVTVTDGNGVGGNPTFSLPQNIDTAAAVQFGRLGLGVSAPATAGMYAASAGANNVTMMVLKRATDTSPTGNFLTLQDAAGGALWNIDITGSLSAGTVPAARISGDAAADGTTKGIAAFTAADFNTSSGVVSLDYTNGQAASGSNKGFLTSADWTTFNGKVATSRSISTTAPLGGGGDLSADRTLTCSTCVTSAAALTNNQLVFGAGSQGTAVGDLTGDITTSGGKATTLATVNSNVGSFTYASITVNAKGLVTAASNGTTPAPANATYVTTSSDGTLSAEVVVASIQKGYLHLNVRSPMLPTSNAARIDGSFNNPRLLFDNTTSQCAWWPFLMNPDYGSSPQLRIPYIMAGASPATNGGVALDVSVMDHAPGASAVAETDSYDTANTCTDASVPSTPGWAKVITCTLTNNDSLTASHLIRVKICRNVSHATDTAASDMAIISDMTLEYTKN